MKRQLIPQDQVDFTNLEELYDPWSFRFNSIEDAQKYMENPIEENVDKYSVPSLEEKDGRIQVSQAYLKAPYETVVLYEKDGNTFKRGFIVLREVDGNKSGLMDQNRS